MNIYFAWENTKSHSLAPADLLDFYENEDVKLDIYNDRWEFASHMDFYVPACARSAYTISMGDSKCATNIKQKEQQGGDLDLTSEIEAFDPDEVRNYYF